MLGNNRFMKKRVSLFARIFALLLPIVCVVLLLTQTAFAKNTFLIRDGGRTTIHTTFATDPAEVLLEAGLTLNTDDTYVTQEGIGVSEITIQRKQTINIVRGNKTLVVSSTGETVEALLKRLNITLTEDDVLSTTMRTKTYDGMVLTISRTVNVKEVYTTAIAYETEYCYDASLEEGEQIVLIPGQDGQIENVANVCYVDGVEVSRTVVEQTVISQSVNALIAVGTKPDAPAPTDPPATQAPTRQPVETTPEAPATPSMPIIGDGIITTPDGEVLTYTSSKQMIATAYTNTDPGCTIWTATGTLCRVGAIAVDPKVIPYGTRMYIVTNDGRYVYGIAVAEDCGGAIKGDRVDLYFNTDAECWTFGVRACTVYFLG